MFGIFSTASSNYSKLAYDFRFNGIDGGFVDLNNYKNKIIVVVNVASRCGFTSQYEDLQKIWERYKKNDLVVIGVPTNNFKQEPGSNKEIKDFCETNFNVNFPTTEKMNVIGKDAHPFTNGLGKIVQSAIPKWNFHKIIVGKDGKVKKLSSITRPSSKNLNH